jgi:steroid 5-alpha reductase family enzyme
MRQIVFIKVLLEEAMISHIILNLALLIHVFFFLAVWKKNFAVMDVAWGLGFIVITLTAYLHSPLSCKNLLLLVLVTLWGMRLALYIFKRSLGQEEDPRYTKMRQGWGKHPNLHAYFKVFLLQAVLMLIISLPVTTGMNLGSTEISWINWFGLGLWVLGFMLESYSDYYLTQFKMKPENKGKILMDGPWKISRYPNYLGEITQWYAIFLVAFEGPIWWSIIGPVTINFFILKVSGIPLHEVKNMKRPEYVEYARRVPRLLPLPVSKT